MKTDTASSTGNFSKNHVIKIICSLIPYLTISIGLFVFHNVWVAVVGYHLTAVIVIFLTKANIPLNQIFHSNNFKIPIISAIICGCGGILLYLLWPFLAIQPDINSYLQYIGLTGDTWPFFLAYFIGLNPIVEEYFWRGYLGNNNKRIVMNDILFSGYHLVVLAGKIEIIWLITVFLVLTFSAWYWRQINRLSEGLLPSIVSHLTADITVILTIYFMTSL
jgi:hypothetical protein